MGRPLKYGQAPPPAPPPMLNNQQTMVPAAIGSSNPHFVPNQFFPPHQNNMNNYPVSMNNMNNCPPMAQSMSFNMFNQNPQMQNMNQLFQLQMMMAGNLFAPQNVPFNANAPNMGFLMNGGQSAPFVGNAQMGFPNPNGVMQNFANPNGAPMGAQQLQGSSAQGTGTVPPLQNQTGFQAQPPQFQGNQRNSNVMNNGKPAQYNNYKQKPRHEAPGNQNTKPRFQKMQNPKGNNNSPNAMMKQGKNNVGAQKTSVDNAAQDQVQQKRSITVLYSDEEIQQWREERKKNFPSKANTEKKLMAKTTKLENIDEEAHLRRQRLKEILAKQAELGCEVAEIPSHYLSDPEQQVHDTSRGGKQPRKRENFKNRFSKRGRFDKDDRNYNKDFAKVNAHHEDVGNDFAPNEKRLANNVAISHRAVKKREPTLLQKLLKADIQRDKHHLMQALRFMVSNTFFENWPKSELKFPPVVVKEAEGADSLSVQESGSSLAQGLGADDAEFEEGEILD